jgi:hypothetical protein
MHGSQEQSESETRRGVKMKLLRASYWLGAAIDALAALQLLIPSGTKVLFLGGLRPAGSAAQPAIMAAALMLGFSALLLWADRRPAQRRGVLAATLAVVVGLALGNLALGVNGDLQLSGFAPTLVIQAVLTALFTSTLLVTRGQPRGRATA